MAKFGGGNIFNLLEDEEGEEVVQANQPQKKSQAAPTASVNTEAKAAKPKPTEKKSANRAEIQASEPVEARDKSDKNKKVPVRSTKDDRKSKTGRGKEMKKDGGGRHNWGKAEDDAKAEPEAPWTAEDKKVETAEVAEGAEEGKAEEKAEDKKPDFITFGEYYKTGETPAEEDNENKDKPAGGLLAFRIDEKRRGRGTRGRGGRNQDSERPTKPAPNPLDFSSFPSLA